jgi:hypothetical protein
LGYFNYGPEKLSLAVVFSGNFLSETLFEGLSGRLAVVLNLVVPLNTSCYEYSSQDKYFNFMELGGL